MKSVSRQQILVHVRAISGTALIVSTCLFVSTHQSAAQTNLQQNPLPPTTWRSASQESNRTVHQNRNGEASRSSEKATPLVVRMSAQQKARPTAPASSLATDLQREKELRMQKISQRLQQLLNAGPGCGPEDSPGQNSGSPQLFPSGTAPFLPPIPSGSEDLSSDVRTMPEPSNSGGMKDESNSEDEVPRPPDHLPVLPSPNATKPLVNDSAKSDSGGTLTSAASQTANESTLNDGTSIESGNQDPSSPDLPGLPLPSTADSSPDPTPATGMPEINLLIDSLTSNSTIDEPEAELATPEPPLSATTVLDSPVDRLRLSDSLFATQEFALALQMYESLDPKQLSNSERYWVTYQQASCLRRLNETAEAQGIYRQLAGDSNAGWLAGLSRWWLDRIDDREELRGEIDQVAKILNAVEEAKSAGTIK